MENALKQTISALNMQVNPKIAGQTLDGFIMNASGCWDHTYTKLVELAVSGTAAIVTKSCTLSEMPGNINEDARVYAEIDQASINSIGLQNLGVATYLEMLRDMKPRSPQKPRFFSVAALGAKAKGLNAAIALVALNNERAAAGGPEQHVILEVNVSCPNAGSALGWRFDEMEETLTQIASIYEAPFGIKLPAYMDISHFERVVSIIKKNPWIQFITCCNALPGLVYDFGDSEPPTAITPNGGIGGVSGPIIKPFALRNVATFHKLFEREGMNVQIIGCGGVVTARDVVEYFISGAVAVQVGFGVNKHGPDVFKHLQTEMDNLTE